MTSLEGARPGAETPENFYTTKVHAKGSPRTKKSAIILDKFVHEFDVYNTKPSNRF